MSDAVPADKNLEAYPAATQTAVAVQDDVEEIVHRIRELKREATFAFVVAVGRLIIDRFYDGDLANWRERGSKDTSFRRLTTRLKDEADLGLDASSLSRAVGVYELLENVRSVATSHHLKVGHFVAVLGLPDKQAEKILLQADKKQWSVPQVRAEAAKYRKHDGRGRKAKLPFVRTIGRFARIVDDRRNQFAGLERIEGLRPDEAKELLRTVEALNAELSAIKSALQTRMELPGE